MSEEVRMTVRVPRAFYEEVKAKAKEDDITVSQFVRWCLRLWVAGKLKPTPLESEEEP
jgi:hypothetical protein